MFQHRVTSIAMVITPLFGQHRLVTMTLLLSVIFLFQLATAAGGNWPPIELGCRHKCGDIDIPFPFGMQRGCFAPGFEVVCNDTFYPPRAFLASTSVSGVINGDWLPDFVKLVGSTGGVFQVTANFYYSTTEPNMPSRINYTASAVELMDVNVSASTARVYAAVSSDCSRNETYHELREQYIKLATESPFLFSSERNELVGVGRSVIPVLSGSLTAPADYQARCQSFLSSPSSAEDGKCESLGCCHQNMPRGINSTRLFFVQENKSDWASYSCSYGMLVEKSWYNFSTQDLQGYNLPNRYQRGVPVVLDFAIRDSGSCPPEGQPLPPQCRRNSRCINATNGPGYFCECKEHFAGNPYSSFGGCQDINECALREQNPEARKLYPCDGICENRHGGYDCRCKGGMKGDAKNGTCTEKFPTFAKGVVGTVGGVFVLAVVLLIILLRREKHKMREFFKKNGGPLLENVHNIKLFKKEELDPILKSGKVIGKGFFSEVFVGLLNDQQAVALKKPINVNMTHKEQFANEIIIQSRVIHKNIVRLIGCCLEVDIPLLVYEFVSKGSLHDILHGSGRMPLNLDVRLNIAAESAEALAYMHSKTTTAILHGDVKPANILLDDNFTPKISDFGISRLLGTARHTNYVIGDRSYMDPIYLQTGLLTKKSDVYSFGIVLLEIITRKKSTYADKNSLVINFLDANIVQNVATELFDMEIVETGNLELLDNLARLAVECLNLDVDRRPEMTDVAERLLMMKRSRTNNLASVRQ